MDGQTDGRMDGRTDGRMDGWMYDVCTPMYVYIYIYTCTDTDKEKTGSRGTGGVRFPPNLSLGGLGLPPKAPSFFQMLYISTNAKHHMHCWCPRSIIRKILVGIENSIHL